MSQLHKTPLEIAYSPSTLAPNYPLHLERYAASGAELIQAGFVQKIAYGSHPDEWFWSSAKTSHAKKIFVFVHGGYWQLLSASESLFLGPGMQPLQIESVSINYSLAPKANLPQMVDQCARALAALAGLYPEAQLVLSGSSAGAHLCAMLISDAVLMTRLGQRLVGVVLCSGVFDLRPLVSTYINEPLGLTVASALEVSPLFCQPQQAALQATRLLLAWGEHETAAFKGQSRQYCSYLQSRGARVQTQELPGKNHFDLVFDFDNPASVLGSFVGNQLTNARLA